MTTVYDVSPIGAIIMYLPMILFVLAIIAIGILLIVQFARAAKKKDEEDNKK